MPHTVLLFAHLTDICKSSTLQIEEQPSVGALRSVLSSKVPALATESFAIAVNRRIVDDQHALCATDEIALLPPFSGG